MKNKILIIVYLFLIFVTVNAEMFIREYNYDASELEGMATARENALKQLKTILLEEVGILTKVNLYIIETEVDGEANEEVRKSIELISEGIMKTKILDENWDGKQFYIKVKIDIDIDDIEKRLAILNSTSSSSINTSKEIMRIVKEYKINKEIEQKKKELFHDLKSICSNYNNIKCLYFMDNIPHKKFFNAKKSFYIPHEIRLILLFDETIFGSSKDGLAICENGIYWHNNLFTPTKENRLLWEEFIEIKITYKETKIFLGNGNVLDTRGCKQSTKYVVKVLKEIQKLLKTKYKLEIKKI